MRLALVDDPAPQRADAADLDLEHVAGLHPQRRGMAVTDAFGVPVAMTSPGASGVKSEM